MMKVGSCRCCGIVFFTAAIKFLQTCLGRFRFTTCLLICELSPAQKVNEAQRHGARHADDIREDDV